MEKLKSRERDVEGVKVSRVYREREKNIIQLIELNPLQEQPAGNFFIFILYFND